jgi:hypothetical protein
MGVYWRSATGSGLDRLSSLNRSFARRHTRHVGVSSIAGAAHPPTVFGYHVMWSTSTLFLLGIMVGAVALLGRSMPVSPT